MTEYEIYGTIFYGYTSFASTTIPNSVTSIRSNAFYWCDALEAVRFEGTMVEWEAVEKGWAWNSNCPFTEVVCSDGVVEV